MVLLPPHAPLCISTLAVRAVWDLGGGKSLKVGGKTSRYVYMYTYTDLCQAGEEKGDERDRGF